jgi:hypothetical protein
VIVPRKKTGKPVPARPIDVYKNIIDDLVEQTPSVSGRLVTEEKIYTRGQGDFGKEMNDFVNGLSEKQRIALAAMLTDERRSGIGDVLSRLTWWINCKGVALLVHGEPMPVDLSGMGIHGDYVGRLEGWNWPKNSQASATDQ